MALQKGDFVEVDYTGKLKDDGIIFDTTDKAVAEKNGINMKQKFGSQVICLGEKQILAGLEDALTGKDIGKHKIELDAEHAFGKKNAKLIMLVPFNKFAKENIMPQPGLQVEIDGTMGIVRKVGGGRVLVDFNHPLSGKDVVYDVDIKRKVTDVKEQIKGLTNSLFGIEPKNIKVEGKKAEIEFEKELPKEIIAQLVKHFTRVLKLDSVEFTAKKEEKKEEKKAETPKKAKTESKPEAK